MTKKKKKVSSRTTKKTPQRRSDAVNTLSASSDIESIPPFILCYGVPGVGKTEWAGNAPDCVFITDTTERGIHVHKQRETVPKDLLVYPPVETWSEYIDNLTELLNQEHDLKYLVSDSQTGFEQLAFQHHCKEYFSDDWAKFMAYYSGPAETAKTTWKESLDLMDRLRYDRGMTVILIAHSMKRRKDLPGKPEFDMYEPVMDSRILQQTDHRMTEILFMDYELQFEEKKRGATKRKVKDANAARYINTEGPTCIAKHWNALPISISMGDSGKEAWENFERELNG